MTRKFVRLSLALALMAASAVFGVSAPAGAAGMTQVSGLGLPDYDGECTELSFDLVLALSGDLEGCLYITVGDFAWHPSGAYQESGTEVFVGTVNGVEGTFETEYIFRGKYKNPEDYSVEVHGRCQHPMVDGSGTGAFAGADGRLHFKDIVETLEFPYTGHFSLD